MRTETKRLQYWDIAKGITILLMVMGHLKPVNLYVRGIIFTYHMPFFFIANAYFIKDYNVKDHFRKSAKSLLLPYCITSLICAVLGTCLNTGQTPDYLIFWQLIKDMVAATSGSSAYFKSFGGVWMLWFLPCLFAAKMVYVAIMGMLQRQSAVVQLFIFMFLAAVGIIVGVYVAYLPWSFDIALASLPFLWAGDYLHKTNALERCKLPLTVISFIIWVAAGSQQLFIELAMRDYPGFYICMIEAVAGSIVVIMFSKVLENRTPILSRWLEFCGRNSIIILAIHNLEARFFDWNKYVFNRLPVTLNWMGVFCVKIFFILLLTCAWCVLRSASGEKSLIIPGHQTIGRRKRSGNL